MSHTKGPWLFTPGNMPAIADSTCKPIAMQCRRDTPEESKANAKLIAASPELLEVAELAFNFMANILHNDDLTEHEQAVYDAARAAIRKAKGE